MNLCGVCACQKCVLAMMHACTKECWRAFGGIWLLSRELLNFGSFVRLLTREILCSGALVRLLSREILCFGALVRLVLRKLLCFCA